MRLLQAPKPVSPNFIQIRPTAVAKYPAGLLCFRVNRGYSREMHGNTTITENQTEKNMENEVEDTIGLRVCSC